ncbi:MAG: gamma-glutamyl-gamma-aminobutyrate hydrolase family protein [Phycisphaerales bacterium]|jgi:gamma-glutamyl-gamma-aminobutyrate hydrolase PuuD|nr:gamma-glutamyl-gamma-aminobutyrate hydrolase family protein [Phycisphaerales bacterium]
MTSLPATNAASPSASSHLPLVGITCDLEDIPQPAVIRTRARIGTTYAEAVIRAGGIPVLLMPDPSLVEHYIARLDAIVFTGGMDIDTRAMGVPLHPLSEVMHPQRQAFELALLRAADRRASLPVLGVCLGMQLMGLHRAGAPALIQHLGDALPTSEQHRHDLHHPLTPTDAWHAANSPLAALDPAAHVASNHHQALRAEATTPMGLRPLAFSRDGVLEAFDDPQRRFYLGVQWHPERTRDPALGQRIFDQLIAAARTK